MPRSSLNASFTRDMQEMAWRSMAHRWRCFITNSSTPLEKLAPQAKLNESCQPAKRHIPLLTCTLHIILLHPSCSSPGCQNLSKTCLPKPEKVKNPITQEWQKRTIEPSHPTPPSSGQHPPPELHVPFCRGRSMITLTFRTFTLFSPMHRPRVMGNPFILGLFGSFCVLSEPSAGADGK